MSFVYFGQMENQARAARIARQLVKPLAISDIEGAISNSSAFRQDNHDRLYAAVDTEYPEIEKRVREFEAGSDEFLPPEVAAKFERYLEDKTSLDIIYKTAWFNLGFAAALRLLSVPMALRKKAVAS